jgi:hypothetical protein
VYIGGGVGASTTGTANTVIGSQAGSAMTSAGSNTIVGALAYQNASGGSCNNSFGRNSLGYRSAGTCNIAIGSYALSGCAGTVGSNTGIRNVAVGNEALQCVSTGQQNSAFGHRSGELISTGSKNVILGSYNGNQFSLDIRTLSNYLVLSDGDGNPRIYHNGTTVVIPNLPTSATGLPVGGLYKCAGTLKVA